MLVSNISGLTELENDELYKQFLAEDFDLKAVTSAAVQRAAVSEQLAKLSAGILILDKALHNQVSEHYEDLLSQATEIETLEGVLLIVHQKISSLLISAEKLRNKIVEPYEEISSLTRKLHRLHLVCDILRRIMRISWLCKRLKSHLNKDSTDITKAANCLGELDVLLLEVDMTGISVIEADLKYINWARTQVEKQ